MNRLLGLVIELHGFDKGAKTREIALDLLEFHGRAVGKGVATGARGRHCKIASGRRTEIDRNRITGVSGWIVAVHVNGRARQRGHVKRIASTATRDAQYLGADRRDSAR